MYLEYRDLARLSQVNRLCKAVSTREDLWRAECLRICRVSCEFFQVIYASEPSIHREPSWNIEWRHLFTQTMQVSLQWKDLKFAGSEGMRTGFHVAEVLRSPEIPCPRLSREGSVYSSSAQQLFADALLGNDFMTVCESAPDLEWMENKAHTLLTEVAGHVEEELLLKARWMLRDTAVSFHLSQAAILRFYHCLKKTIQTHCHFIKSWLEETQSIDALLVQYCTHWAAYSAACNHLESDLSVFTSLLNDVYEAKFPTHSNLPRFTIVKFMTILWRRIVFDHFQEDLMRAAEVAISEANRDQRSRDKIQVFAQALVDLSVDEYTVHMLQHSKVQLDGPYNSLQTLVLSGIKRRIRDISDIEKCAELWSEETQLAERVYLPVTCRLVGETIAEKELSLLTSYFQSLVRSQQWRHESVVQEDSSVLNSAFGLFCFNLLNYHKPHTIQLISWLLTRGQSGKITRFNDLSEMKDLELLEDEWIERKAKQLFRLPVSIPSALRSTAHDLKRTDLGPGWQDCSA